MNIVHEKLSAITLRPDSPEVNHRPGMRVTTPYLIRGFAIGVVPLIANPVPVVGNGFYVVKGVGVEVLPRLSLVPSTLNRVIQVGNDTGRLKRMSVIIEINAPRIARAL